MPLICYEDKRFRDKSLTKIALASKIIQAYARQGLDLTLRQLYYRFVAAALIPNKQSEYKKLGKVISDARLAGLIDWSAIVDRTRHLRALDNWTDPHDILDDCARWYHLDRWRDQENRVEVWIEKDALVGVIQQVCQRNDVAYFSCRGYASQSSLWRAARRIGRYIEGGQKVTVLHLGDHDASGIDMTRDIERRLDLYLSHDGHHHKFDWEIDRIALNMDQVRRYRPPPNPARQRDPRAAEYIAEFGDQSWELDALEPPVLIQLIEDAIVALRDDDAWDALQDEEEVGRRRLRAIANMVGHDAELSEEEGEGDEE